MNLLAFLAAAALPLSAQVVAGPGRLEAVGGSVKRVQEGLERPKADPKIYESLVRRLMTAGEQEETEAGPAWKLEGPDLQDKAKDPALLVARLYGTMLPSREVAPESGIFDLGLRYVHSYLEVMRQTEKKLDDGSVQLDTWIYLVGVDGTISSVTRAITVVKMEGEEVSVDEARSRVLKMDPRDESVVRRWRRLEKKLIFLGPTLEA